MYKKWKIFSRTNLRILTVDELNRLGLMACIQFSVLYSDRENRPKQGDTHSYEHHIKTGVSLPKQEQVPSCQTTYPTLLLSTSHSLAYTASHSRLPPPGTYMSPYLTQLFEFHFKLEIKQLKV